MPSSRNIRAWAFVHTWSSLICTLFLLLICATGLPLVFGEEIEQWLHPVAYANLPSDSPRADLDRLATRSRRIYPGQIITSVFVDDDEPQVVVAMAPSWAALDADPKAEHFIRFDARTAQVIEQSKPRSQQQTTFMGVMLSLHRDLFAGLPGGLFLATMGLMLVAAIVSGIALYGPFTRRLDFGTIRADRSRRLQWLDLHNLLGIVTLAWALVVGATGVMNELETPLFALWQRTDVAAAVAPWQGQAPPDQGELSSVQAAFDAGRRALPGMVVTTLIFPGGQFGSPHHYLLFAKGATPLTGQLVSPVLIDARTGRFSAVLRMPWYLRVLELSRPLHFGDYGGIPLKIIWALLDLATIVVSVSGLYLWIGKRKRFPVETNRKQRTSALLADLLEAAE